MGTEEFWVPAVLTALSAGGSAYNSISANDRAQKQEVAGIQEQQDLRQKAAGAVNKTVQNIQGSNPNTAARQSTSDFISQLRQNEGANNPLLSAANATPGADKRYAAGGASTNAAVQNYGDTQASDLGQMTGAVRQRQEEGNDTSSLGTQLGLYGEQSGQDSFLTQLRAAASGVPNPWVGLGSSLLGAGAKGLISSGALAPASAAGGVDESVAGPSAGAGSFFGSTTGGQTPIFNNGFGAAQTAAANKAFGT
jgi:hypothetical protein